MKTSTEPSAKMASLHQHVHVLTSIICLLIAAGACPANEWQWSMPNGNARDYLWIPPNCERVRAIVIANHNMIEQGILEHARMRQTLADLGFAEVWCVPLLEQSFDFRAGAAEHLQKVLGALADQSGYDKNLRNAGTTAVKLKTLNPRQFAMPDCDQT